MKIQSVGGHDYAHAAEYFQNNGSCRLVSYSTTVIVIDNNGWLKVNGLYSRTTIKHIGWFMRERGLTYQLAKRCYLENISYNINTREFKNN